MYYVFKIIQYKFKNQNVKRNNCIVITLEVKSYVVQYNKFLVYTELL